MTPTPEPYDDPAPKISGRADKRLVMACALLVLAGAAAFLAGINGPDAARAWQAYLINFVFWTGLASGTVMFSATLTITHARWGRSVKRLSEAPGAFLPVAFLLFWVLFFGKDKLFTWINEPVPEKAAWLSAGFLFARDGAALLLLAAAAVALIYHSVQRDLKYLSNGRSTPPAGPPQEEDSHEKAQLILSPIYGILYALVLSLIAFDLIMSLSPHWYSTLFGAYYFMGSFYSGLAALIVLAAFSVRKPEFGRFVRPSVFHDLGKLLLAFCLVTGDFFYTQFLVMWYGNLPEETRFIILRVRQSPWAAVAWTVLIVCFALPFLVLLSRKIKMKQSYMLALSLIILCGMWLERLLLVAPSIWMGKQVPVGMTEIFITAGFLGAVGLSALWLLRRFPMLPVGDPLFRESVESILAADDRG